MTLICSQNPCPCGHLGDAKHSCTCHPREIFRYRNKISGPLMDRIDLQIEVPAIPYQELGDERNGEPSAVIRGRVRESRTRQQKRFAGHSIHCNAQMGPTDVQRFCPLSSGGRSFLQDAARRLALSARAYDRILKIARTIADLNDTKRITTEHLAEAVQYRSLDRQGHINV